MIMFETIRFRNFLSYGDQFTEIEINKTDTTVQIGKNGTGKCLDPSTEIDIAFNDAETRKKFEDEVSVVARVTILDIADFYNENPECIGHISVDGRHGYKTIEYAGVTAYDSDVCELTLQNGHTVKASPEHKLFVNGDWKYVKNISNDDYVHVKNGISKVKSCILTDEKKDLYDLQVADVHEFYANDIVSHNSIWIDALSFALFGKPYRNINKPQLVNSVNEKNLIVELTFSIGSNKYMIRRGMKPNIFEIYKNGQHLDQTASSVDYQKQLEQTILKMNAKTFKQIVVLSKSTFVPFMQLNAADRREIIEELLDIRIFSTMNNLLKTHASEIKTELKDIEYRLDVNREKVEIHRQYLKNMKDDKKAEILAKKKSIAEHEEGIKKLEDENEQMNQLITAKKQALQGEKTIQDARDQYQKFQYTMKSTLEGKETDLEFFTTHDDCPTCQQSIDEDFKSEVIESRRGSIDKINKNLDELQKTMKSNQKAIDDMVVIHDQIADSKSKVEQNTAYIESYTDHNKTIMQEINDLIDERNKITNTVDVTGIQADSQELIALMKKMSDEQHYNAIASQLLKDTGIKTIIIKKYLPAMNQLINRYLGKLNFFVSFEIDENFAETIKSRYRDEFSYSSFSEGEKFRIDIALLYTWREIARMKNSVNTNLLILDEIFDSSLDTDGIDDFISLLGSLPANTNTFIITHRDQNLDRFNRTLQFDKRGNFSTITEKE